MEFPNNTLLTPQPYGYVSQERDIEDIVELYRPSNKINRAESVFMVDNPDLIDFAGGYEDYVYQVMPIGQVDKSDLSWYSEVSIYLDATEEEQAEWSRNYWNSVPYKNPSNSLWEYRARSAKIVKMISHS
ncbi:MAG: hypothetical protein WC375_13040 [Methanomassiliicoccales archaeon]|jgi:hypothetical protein